MPRLPPDWASALGPPWDDPVIVEKLVDRAYTAVGPNPILPTSRDEVFRVFELTSFAIVRLVIVGQDPYPDATLAHGVAFSAPGARVPKALDAVFSNLEASKLASPFSRPSPDNGDLSAWARHGVLLLNASLTYQKDRLGPHCRLWESFIRSVLTAVTEGAPVQCVLMGGKAANLRSAVPPDAAITVGHPTPRNTVAQRFPLFRDARPFAEADEYLRKNGLATIDWSLS